MDYTNFEWFKDAPPRREVRSLCARGSKERVAEQAPQVEVPSAPQTMSDSYVPLPGVIEQNEMFSYALSSAPNVLFSRFKQYGQVRPRPSSSSRPPSSPR